CPLPAGKRHCSGGSENGVRGGGRGGSITMQQFTQLVKILSNSTKTNEKLEALRQYFATAHEQDKPWVLALFSGRRPRRTVNSAQLKSWCIQAAGLPEWLFDECYHTVGDL